MSLDPNKPFRRLLTPVVECANTAPKLGFPWGAMSLVALTLFLAIIGCTSDADNIRASNEAARTPPATSTPLSAEIGTTEIQDGDCINSTLPEGIDIESVVIVPCSADWQYRALSSFEVHDLDRYPGEATFLQRAYRGCDRRFTFTLFPTEDSWGLGDRKVTCLQESFGLSSADPAKLDRLVKNDRLNDDECFNEFAADEHGLVELVSCTGEWQYRTLNSFAVADASRYPGEVQFSLSAHNKCDRRFTNTLYPTAESWALGERVVTCIQDSFGLSKTDPAKLDRLVNNGRLNLEECFKEAQATDGTLVEVVSCSGEWQFRVLNSFLVEDQDRYPGEGLFSIRAYNECDQRSTNTLSPTRDSWDLGDRKITCLQEDFGLSATDPAKLDRLVDPSGLTVEQCFNEAPETAGLLVELVSCSSEPEFQVRGRFLISIGDEFPGEDHINEIANRECDDSFDFFYYHPTAESWSLGDRTITCIRSAP